MKINGIDYDENMTLQEFVEKVKLKGEMEDYALISTRTGNIVKEETAEDILKSIK